MPPRALRCSYREDNRRCPRNGAGNPPLCRAHREEIAGQWDSAPTSSSLGDLFAKIVTGKRVTDRDIKSAATEVAGLFGAAQRPSVAPGQPHWPGRFTESAQDQARRVHAEREQREREQRERRAREDLAKLRKDDARARKVLGFTSKDKLTKPILDLRRRELAKKHHPDRGGSTVKMQEINQAVDFLLQTVDN